MFGAIFDKAPDHTYVEVTTFEGDRPRRTFVPVPDAQALIETMPHNGVDVYYGVALRSRQGSEKGDVYGTKVLWSDIDRGAIPYATLPPSFIVFSGGGWHYYWLLDEWCTDLTTIEDANKALMEDTDGDSCWNANRLLRVPGTTNTKYDIPCELRQQWPSRTYTLSDVRAIGRLDGKARHKIRTGDSRGYKSRSERDWAIVESLVVAGASDELIRHLFLTQPCGDKFRDPKISGEKYLAHTIEQVREKSRTVRKADKNINFGDFIETEDGYYMERSRGRQRVSTFLFVPTLLLEGDKEDVLVGSVHASGYEWKDVKLPRSAFNDRRALDKYLIVSAWSWLGKDDDVRMLLPWLLKKLQETGLPRSKATTVLGRHGDKFVLTAQTLDAENLWTGVDGPLVHLDSGKEVPKVKVCLETSQPDLSRITEINKPEVLWSVLGWFAAAPMKTLFESRGVRFPILNVYGTRGSGKTSMIREMQRLFGYEAPVAYDCTTTRFVMLGLLGYSNAVPISFSEFRASVGERVTRFILLAYDTGHDQRGRGDQTTVDYPLSAPFTVDGEDLVPDPACKERLIAVNLHPESIAEGTPAYDAFSVLRQTDLSGFYGPYLRHTLTLGFDDLLAEARKQVFEAFPETLPDRVRNNMTVVRAGQLAFLEHTGQQVKFNTTVRDVFSPVLSSVWSKDLGRGQILADEFAEGVVNAVAGGKADFFYTVESAIVWFQLATTFDWWKRHRRFSGSSTLDRDAIRNQLVERDVEKGGKGQYIVKPRMVQGRWCYGISLSHAMTSGLDVPGDINVKELRIRI